MERKLKRNPLNSKIEKFAKGEVLTNSHKHKMFLVRHAESQFNVRISHLDKIRHEIELEEYCNRKAQIRFSPDLCDCEITENGRNQCFEAGQSLRGLNVKYIFVSPMKRCLMTCDNIINSINLNNINPITPEVIVHPLLFEKTEDSCDLLKDIDKSMRDYSLYDWSLFDGIEHLSVYQLLYFDNYLITHTQSNKINYYEQTLDNFTKQSSYNNFELVLDAMEKLSKMNKLIESSKKTLERLGNFIKFLSPYTNTVKEDEKILIIGHSVLFQHITSEYIDVHNCEPSQEEQVLKNCEIVGVTFN